MHTVPSLPEDVSRLNNLHRQVSQIWICVLISGLFLLFLLAWPPLNNPTLLNSLLLERGK